MTPLITTTLSDGTNLPVIGQGTWMIGDDPAKRADEIHALRTGIDAGMTVIDTAEMYGGGRAEDLVGEAISSVRSQVYLISKVLPWNASRTGTVVACESSIRTLGTEWIDLYLLHWRGSYPVQETVEAFLELQERDLIGAWGVSNFDPAELLMLPSVPVVNQVLYNPSRRGIEFDLLSAHRGSEPHVTTMAYSPIEQGQLLKDPTINEIARAHEASAVQILLAWAIRTRDVIAIPKASHPDRTLENANAASIRLTEEDLDKIDATFPPPRHPQSLEVI